ncbi:hypothetical protein BJP34_16825 [Moorena producens PAL-8-15-08-1]|uniref:Uncharacterized protein n=1 Tax=Moorena producens PAL-8-15-08-1 TaxID=1458985 RepID=A0A1D8TTC0_9CYAN|nr:hypothetical protein [Moorena producens]AOX00888.1 hypothetical protein BJP34_16825 [Moorena producens PAL-8-15-08-1]
MSVNLRINEIVIGEGIDLPRSMRRVLQAAVETELARLLAEKGLPHSLEQDSRIPGMQVDLELKGKTSPDHLGKMVAQSIYEQLTK